MKTIQDSIDLSAYMRSESDDAVLVRKASSFAKQLRAEFARRAPGQRQASMFSTKLGKVLEFRPGEVTVWAGYNGHRKSMFVGQVALDLLVQRRRVLIASFEMTPARTLARMSRQAFACESPLDDQLDRFSAWTDERLWVFDHLGRISPQRCIAVCKYFAGELYGEHVVIDSMMMVCASEEHLDEQKQFTTDIVRLAVETGLHVHLVAHCRKPQSGEDRPPTKYDLRGSAAISDQASNVVTIWSNKAKKARAEAIPGEVVAAADALVSVEKQRNGRWEGRAQLCFDEEALRFYDERDMGFEAYTLNEFDMASRDDL